MIYQAHEERVSVHQPPCRLERLSHRQSPHQKHSGRRYSLLSQKLSSSCCSTVYFAKDACQTSVAWATKQRPLMWHRCYSTPLRVLEQNDWVTNREKKLHKHSGHEYRTTLINAQADFTPRKANNHAAAQLSASTPSQPARLPIAMWKLKTRNTNAICTTNNVTGSLTGPWGLRRRHVSAFQQSLCPATEFVQVITTNLQRFFDAMDTWLTSSWNKQETIVINCAKKVMWEKNTTLAKLPKTCPLPFCAGHAQTSQTKCSKAACFSSMAGYNKAQHTAQVRFSPGGASSGFKADVTLPRAMWWPCGHRKLVENIENCPQANPWVHWLFFFCLFGRGDWSPPPIAVCGCMLVFSGACMADTSCSSKKVPVPVEISVPWLVSWLSSLSGTSTLSVISSLAQWTISSDGSPGILQ